MEISYRVRIRNLPYSFRRIFFHPQLLTMVITLDDGVLFLCSFTGLELYSSISEVLNKHIIYMKNMDTRGEKKKRSRFIIYAPISMYLFSSFVEERKKRGTTLVT